MAEQTYRSSTLAEMLSALSILKSENNAAIELVAKMNAGMVE
jgi:hypothetical protein